MENIKSLRLKLKLIKGEILNKSKFKSNITIEFLNIHLKKAECQ